jgi:hypothetical protein
MVSTHRRRWAIFQNTAAYDDDATHVKQRYRAKRGSIRKTLTWHEGTAALGNAGGFGEGGRPAGQQPNVVRGQCEQAATDDVTQQRDGKVLPHLPVFDHALHPCRSAGGGIAREELSTRHDDQQQIHGEECGEGHLHETGVGEEGTRHVPRHAQREEATETNVGPAEDGLVQNLGPMHLGVGLSLLGKLKRKKERRKHHRRRQTEDKCMNHVRRRHVETTWIVEKIEKIIIKKNP